MKNTKYTNHCQLQSQIRKVCRNAKTCEVAQSLVSNYGGWDNYQFFNFLLNISIYYHTIHPTICKNKTISQLTQTYFPVSNCGGWDKDQLFNFLLSILIYYHPTHPEICKNKRISQPN